MSRRFLHWFAVAALVAAHSHALAAVDVNAADEAALISIKGVGPAKARAILEERAARGPFADAADLAQRVKGFGGRTLERLQAQGLEVGPGAQRAPTSRVFAARDAARAQARPAAMVMRP